MQANKTCRQKKLELQQTNLKHKPVQKLKLGQLSLNISKIIITSTYIQKHCILYDAKKKLRVKKKNKNKKTEKQSTEK